MKIALATDHAGFELKEHVKSELIVLGYDVQDFGAHAYDALDDYPDFIGGAAKFVSENSDSKGIIFGGSGQGEAMSANRFNKVRAAVFYGSSAELIKLSRLHNDANMLSIGARFVEKSEIMKFIQLWLDTDFEGGRHIRRIEKLDTIVS